MLLTRLDLRARAERSVREIAVCLAAVLLVGTAAAQQPQPQAPTSAIAAVPPASAPSPTTPATTTTVPARELADRLVPAVPSPTPEPSPAPTTPPAVERWLPSGTGMWLHDWRRSESGHAQEVVARAKASGLTHLYVQTGSSRKGWIGQEVLSQLLPATKGTGLDVIAWDFPKLDDPEADARRLARAAFWHRDGVPMISAVAPDVETAAEGTRVTPERVRRYYTELRKRLPKRTAILATVPWPSEKRTARYPYAVTAPFADAFVPMAYWYNRDPGTVTATSMSWLQRFGKPVMPVGQGYDGRLDAPYLPADPDPAKSVQAFVDAAHRGGARSISLWSWQATGALQWGVLARASSLYAPPPPVAAVVPGPTVAPSPSAGPVRPDGVPGRKPRPGRPAPAPSPSPLGEPSPEPAAG